MNFGTSWKLIFASLARYVLSLLYFCPRNFTVWISSDARLFTYFPIADDTYTHVFMRLYLCELTHAHTHTDIHTHTHIYMYIYPNISSRDGCATRSILSGVQQVWIQRFSFTRQVTIQSLNISLLYNIRRNEWRIIWFEIFPKYIGAMQNARSLVQ